MLPFTSQPSPDRGALPAWLQPAAHFDGMPDFDATLLPHLARLPLFRQATEDEVDASYAAYQTGDVDTLLSAWRRVALPTRAHITGLSARIYGSVGTLPQALRRLAVLATLRSVLVAGVRFRAGLRPDVRRLLETEFPWLEQRHQHIPPGFAPHFDFPPEFARFLESGTLDDARVRWQICAALNEVQQCVYSADMAQRCRLPELQQQSEREAELARNYFAHASPRVSRRLWQQCIVILDALNAAVLAMTCSLRGPLIVLGATLDSLRPAARGQWLRFQAGLTQPQFLLPPAAPGAQVRG